MLGCIKCHWGSKAIKKLSTNCFDVQILQGQFEILVVDTTFGNIDQNPRYDQMTVLRVKADGSRTETFVRPDF